MSGKMHDLPDFKTSLKNKICSIPKIASAGRYLDLYILNREKTRTEQELRSLKGRMKNLESTLRCHQKSMAHLEKEFMNEGNLKKGRKTVGNPYKAIRIEY